MRRVTLCIAVIAVVAGCAHAVTITDIPMNAWRVVDGSSNVAGDHLLLRNESAVQAVVNMEIGALGMSARTTAQRRQGVLTNLTLIYDDGAQETVSARVDADMKQHEVAFEPSYAAWRHVVGLKLVHPADGMELVVTRLVAGAELPAMYVPPSGLTSAGVLSGATLAEGLLRVKRIAGGNPPQITAPTSRKIIVYAAKIAQGDYGLDNAEALGLVAKDANGRELKRFTALVSGRVQPVLFYLSDIDLAQVDRLVFDAAGSSDFVIRGLTAGDAVAGGQASTAELKQVNDRLDILITFIEQGGQLPQAMVWQLKQLLIDYRRIE